MITAVYTCDRCHARLALKPGQLAMSVEHRCPVEEFGAVVLPDEFSGGMKAWDLKGARSVAERRGWRPLHAFEPAAKLLLSLDAEGAFQIKVSLA